MLGIKELAWIACLVCMVNASHLCEDKHPQESYCDADFVVRGKVKSVQLTQDPVNGWQRKYKVRIGNPFKGNFTKGSIYDMILEVYIGSRVLRTGVEYLLSGSFEDSDIRIDECDWVQPFNTLSPHLVIGVKRRYEKHCQCKPGKKLCKYDDRYPLHCFKRYATCKQKDTRGCGQLCKWKFGGGFRRCCGVPTKG